MDIFRKNTKKGVVIRYVFDDEDEYNNLIGGIKTVCDTMPEEDRTGIQEVIKLFKDYYNPKSDYAEGKPTVTVFEDHLLTLAVLVWNIVPIYLAGLKGEIEALKKYAKEIKEHTETMHELKDAKQTIIDYSKHIEGLIK